MISVALCVYNGERFLAEQLASIEAQTLRVDELVVCDDGSTDNTLNILEKFSKKASFPIHIHQNTKQLGSTKNFEKCLRLCKGDIIFLCDQDDYWYPEKVAKQIQYLEENPTMEAVFSDGGLIDGDSKLKEGRMWDAIQFDKVCQEKWKNGEAHQILFRGYVVTGATLAIRARVLSKLMPFPDGIKTMIHDSWIALLLSLTNQIGFVNKPLINYRIHASQQVGFGAATEYVTLKERFSRPRAEKLAPIEKEWAKLETIHQLLKNKAEIPAEKLNALIQRKKHIEARKQLPENRIKRIMPVMIELLAGNYYDRQVAWWKTVLGDLLE
jgi:glycosyltransferase involved in cell wall biosynthesis